MQNYYEAYIKPEGSLTITTNTTTDVTNYASVVTNISGDPRPIDVYNDAGMAAVLRPENYDKCYRFIGTSSTKYVTNDLYMVPALADRFNHFAYEAPPFTGLCFTANTDNSTITLTYETSAQWSGFYSLNKGLHWRNYYLGQTITLNSGESVWFKGTSTLASTTSNYLYFVMTGSISASGNVFSLVDQANYESLDVMTGLHRIPYLFKNCTALVTPPALPVFNLTDYCYYGLFQGCTSLESVPSLSVHCYDINSTFLVNMFSGCTSLQINDAPVSGVAEQAWVLPESQPGRWPDIYTSATNMFLNCAGTRSTDSPNWSYDTKTYYTKNIPVKTLYSINYLIAAVSCTNKINQYMSGTKLITLNFKAEEGYTLPSTIIVEGALYDWNSFTGELTLINTKGAGSISITIIGESSSTSWDTNPMTSAQATADGWTWSGNTILSNTTERSSYNLPTSIDGARMALTGTNTVIDYMSVTSISAPGLLAIPDGYAFGNRWYLASLYLPNCTYVGSSTLMSCPDSLAISLPECRTLGNSAIYSHGRSQVSLPKLEYLGAGNLNGYGGSTLTLPCCTTIASGWGTGFSGATNLVSLTLGASKVCDLQVTASEAFYGTPILSGTGSIYVPSNLVSDYQVAQNWSEISSRIFPII